MKKKKDIVGGIMKEAKDNYQKRLLDLDRKCFDPILKIYQEQIRWKSDVNIDMKKDLANLFIDEDWSSSDLRKFIFELQEKERDLFRREILEKIV